MAKSHGPWERSMNTEKTVVHEGGVLPQGKTDERRVQDRRTGTDSTESDMSSKKKKTKEKEDRAPKSSDWKKLKTNLGRKVLPRTVGPSGRGSSRPAVTNYISVKFQKKGARKAFL